MKVIEDLKFKDYILDKIAKREFYERTGIHCSDLIYCLNKSALRQLKPLEPTEDEILTFSIGWATQRWLTGTFDPDTEIEVDGIIVTPDFFFDKIPWELKATYQSANKNINENQHWIRQVMAQCYVTGKTEARLSRFCIMGDWKWVFGKKEEKALSKRPILQAWHFTFSQEELDGFWTWMKERRDKFAKILKSKELLPKVKALASGDMSWECNYCKYVEECQGGGI